MTPLVSVIACSLLVSAARGQDTNADFEVYSKYLQINPRSALAHYRLGEIFFTQNNLQSAANEFREALNGDSPPAWIVTSSHLQLGRIFEKTGQKERAENEFRLAAQTKEPEPVVAEDRSVVVQPEYSEEALLAGLEGVVTIAGVIGANGELQAIRIVKPLGLGLDEKALAAAREVRFPAPDGENLKAVVRAEFLLPERRSRWHLAGVEFQPPPGASRPVFANAWYPFGPGLSREAIDYGHVVVAMRRNATATVSFDIDTHGRPGNFRVVGASDETWGPQAIGVVREWVFQPGLKDGIPVTVPCTLTLVWGERKIPAMALASAFRPLPRSSFTPNIRYQPDPLYSQAALEAKREGIVAISLVIGMDGKPSDLRVAQSLGLGLDEMALEAVAKWRFEPALVNGQPSPMPATVHVPFRLPRR